MNIIFAGTPDFSVPALKSLHAAGHNILAVYTQPDRQAGRGRRVIEGPVKQAARELGLRIEQPVSLRNNREAAEALATLHPDVMVVVAYGLILPQDILAIPRYGCINIHASLLPRWRGAAPIQRAIEHGDEKTGITIMQMDAGLDTGDILATYPVDISDDETGQSLHDKLADIGGSAITEVLDGLESSLGQARAQDDADSTYAAKLDRSESEIDWAGSSLAIERKIRAFNPWPLAKTSLAGTRLNIYAARTDTFTSDAPPGTILSADASGITVQCGDGALKITRLQRAGGRPMDVKDFLNGIPVEKGSRLGTPE